MANDVPFITGVESNGYRVGDYVNLTCISRAKTAPKLSFIVNDLEVCRGVLGFSGLGHLAS